jgi:three-Cys-motif partner protein
MRKTHPDQLPLELGFAAPSPSAPRRVQHHRSAAHRRLDDHPQTRLKLNALAAYLPRWLRILGLTRSGRDLYLIDAFAGPGTYPDGEDNRGWSEGSPLIACMAADYAQQWFAGRGRRVTVHLRFVERRRSTARVLENALVPFRGRVDYEVINGLAEEKLARLLAESEGHPTFILLDPDGFRQLTMDLVRSCAREFTEVMISFDVQGAIRTAGLRDASTLTAFYGDDMWRLLRGADGTIDVSQFLEGYRVRLGEVFRYTTVKRLVYTAEHANRALVQGCGSERGVREWAGAFGEAERPEGVEVFEFVAAIDDQARIDGAIVGLRALAGQETAYGRIVQTLGGLELDEERIHQALLFLRDRGHVTWTSQLHRDARPVPRIRFAPDLPADIHWDGLRRAREGARPRVSPAAAEAARPPSA